MYKHTNQRPSLPIVMSQTLIIDTIAIKNCENLLSILTSMLHQRSYTKKATQVRTILTPPLDA